MKPTFVIKEFTNPSGEVVFRVSGWLNGKRIRQNFPTFGEAKAEAVVRRLAGKPRSLSFYVDLGRISRQLHH